MTSPRSLSWRKKALFGVGMCLALAAVVEGAARLMAPPADAPRGLLVADRLTGTALHKGFEGTSHSGFGVTVQVSIGALGHRDTDRFASPKPAGAFRIACLGGSTTFGFGASTNASAYPKVLQARLAGRVEVLNAGVHGWNVRSSLLNLRRLDLDLDGAVVLHGHNDLYENYNPAYRAAAEGKPPPAASALVQLLERSVALRSLRQRLLRSRRRTLKHEALSEPGARAFERNLLELVAELKGRGLRVLLCTFPSLYRQDWEQTQALYPPDGERPSAQVRDFLRNSIHTYPVFVAGLARYNQIVRDVAAREGVDLCDLERELPRTPAFYVDFVHHTDAGHVAKADLIAVAIRKAGWLR